MNGIGEVSLIIVAIIALAAGAIGAFGMQVVQPSAASLPAELTVFEGAGLSDASVKQSLNRIDKDILTKNADLLDGFDWDDQNKDFNASAAYINTLFSDTHINYVDLNVWDDINTYAIEADYYFGGAFYGSGSGLTGLSVDTTLDNNVLAQAYFWSNLAALFPVADVNIGKYIPSETDIDNNAIQAVRVYPNVLPWADANINSYIPKKVAIDSNVWAAISTLFPVPDANIEPYIPTEANIDNNALALMKPDTTCDTNTAGCSTYYNKTDVNAHFIPYIGADFDVNLGGHRFLAFGDSNFANIGVSGNAFLNTLKVSGVTIGADSNFTNIGITQGLYANRINVTGDSNFTNIGLTGNVYGDSSTIFYGDKFQCDNCIASGLHSFAAGYSTTASGSYSVTMGLSATASGNQSVAMGNTTIASGLESVAFGRETTASGARSFATGLYTTASNSASTALGTGTKASGQGSFAAGNANVARDTIISSDFGSVAMGYTSDAGSLVQATGMGAIAVGAAGYSGTGSITSEDVGSVAMGVAIDGNMISSGKGSVALGYNAQALGEASVVLGKNLTNYKANSVLVQDLNSLGDANVNKITAGKYFGDGSALTGVLTMADANAHYVPYIGADYDTNLGRYDLRAEDLNAIRIGAVDAHIRGRTYTTGITSTGDSNFTNAGATTFFAKSVGIDGNLRVGGAVNDHAYFFFDNADVGDTTDGQSLYVYRRAVEADDYMQMYIHNTRAAYINSNRPLYLQNAGNNRLGITAGVYSIAPFYIKDSLSGNYLNLIVGGTALTAGRSLTIDVSDLSPTVKFSSLSSFTFDQQVNALSSPTFGDITLGTATTSGLLPKAPYLWSIGSPDQKYTDLWLSGDVIAQDLNFSGSLYATGQKQGITDSSSYWLCTASNCATTCQAEITDGIITGCT